MGSWRRVNSFPGRYGVDRVRHHERAPIDDIKMRPDG